MSVESLSSGESCKGTTDEAIRLHVQAGNVRQLCYSPRVQAFKLTSRKLSFLYVQQTKVKFGILASQSIRYTVSTNA